jgi:hypothetical protein
MDGVYDWNTRFLTTLADGTTKVVPPDGFWGALYSFNSWSFLHHMGLIFVILAGYMIVMTKRQPLAEPRVMPVSTLDVTPHPKQYLMGGVVIAMTAVLYIIFW